MTLLQTHCTKWLAVRHRMRFGLELLALSLAILCAPAQAMSLRQLNALEKQDKQGSGYVRYYLVGVMEGLLEAQKTRPSATNESRICPADKRMEPSMAYSLFDAERKRNRELYEADMPVALVMRNALQNAYPCPE